MSIDPGELPEERYRGERVALASRVQKWARRVLLVGADRGRLGYLLQKRGCVEAHGLEWDAAQAANAETLLTTLTAGMPGGEALPFPSAYFDVIVITSTPAVPAEFEHWLTWLAPWLGPQGQFVVLLPNPEYWAAPPGGTLTFEAAAESASRSGWPVYSHWSACDERFAGLTPDSAGRLHIAGKSFDAHDKPSQERLSEVDYCLLLVRPDYNPLNHAHECFDAGHPGWAHEILRQIPEPYLKKEEVAAGIYQETMLCLLNWAKRGVDGPLDRYFYQAVELFYGVVKTVPDAAPAYQCMAAFWQIMGDNDMAARVLRSVQRIAPSEPVARHLASIPVLPRRDTNVTPPVWTPPARPPRILFVMHPRPHYGLDVLYDGLCLLLGPESVVDYPYKPTLHGEVSAEMANYPCTFNWQTAPHSLEQVLDELSAGRFDLILYGDCEYSLPQDAARRIASANSSTPFFIVDALDQFFDCAQDVMEQTGRAAIDGYFKREMLACLEYRERTFPLPFAYADGRVPAFTEGPRTLPFFWAGHRNFSLRRLYLERIEAMLGAQFGGRYAQDEYTRTLLNAQIGLNCFGMGFDTVRYWELPAHGCLLLSERLPIHVPHNFEDGVSAVFFDDAEDLERRLQQYLGHPEERAAIAAAGRQHFRQYHTGSARASQMLAWVQEATGR